MENENEEVVLPEDATSESSTEETQVEEATSGKATEEQPKEPPFHEHPRWKEKQAELREIKEQNAKLQDQLFSIINNNKPNQEQIEQKIYDANTPEEREFWQKIEKIAETKSKAQIKEMAIKFEEKEKALLNQYGRLAANEFLKAHPDVERGSTELEKILDYSRRTGLDLDESYKIVMYDKSRESAVEEYKKKQETLKKKKLAANVETKTNSKESPFSKNDEDFDDVFGKLYDEAASNT